MFKGSMMLGDFSQDQLGCFRPVLGWADYRTPIDNLYMASGTCHPSGGCTCAPGYNCAGIITDDLKIKKWWSPISMSI